MRQSLLDDDHEDNEYIEEYAKEPLKEGVGRIAKIFLMLLSSAVGSNLQQAIVDLSHLMVERRLFLIFEPSQ